MKKMVKEVNDQEICRRLDILCNSEKDDFPVAMCKQLLESPEDFPADEVQEPYVQYVRHFIYMAKREKRLKERDASESASLKSSKKSAAKKKARKKSSKKSG